MPTKLLFTLFSLILFSQNLLAEDYKWTKKLTFLGFLKHQNIPLKIYYDMDREDKELVQEIRAGQTYTIKKKISKNSYKYG